MQYMSEFNFEKLIIFLNNQNDFYRKSHFMIIEHLNVEYLNV